MKRSTKLGLGGALLLLGTVVLSGCTASFCSVTDKAHMLYAFDYGVTEYTIAADPSEAMDGFNKVKAETSFEYSKYVTKVNTSAEKSGFQTPSIKFWAVLDEMVLEKAIDAVYGSEGFGWQEFNTKYGNDLPGDPSDLTVQNIRRTFGDGYEDQPKGILDVYGYLKFEKNEDSKKLWASWDAMYKDILVNHATYGLTIDECPSTDYAKLYKSTMNSAIASYRSCLATETGDYGAYGPNSIPVEIQGKKWTSWNGLLEFLLVYPIGAFIDVLVKGFSHAGVMTGWSQLLAILVATVVIRSIMLLFTIRQTRSQAKMTELQPQIQKIQAKYPNANTNQYEKQRMAGEMQALYKKNKINPLSSLLTLVIQFPVFICVWGALQGSAYLSSGSFLGLRLSDSISSVLFSSTGWKTGGAVTALILFLLMASSQVISMLLPQWYQKKKEKEATKLGRNPNMQKQNKNMKIFTYVMMIMIIIMGFSLASGLGVYWFVGALFSIVQTVIMQTLAAKKKNKK